MSLGTANRDGGKTSESGHLRALSKAFRAEVTNGLNVSQRGAGANMSVDIAIGDAFVPRSDGTYSHPVFNDAILNQVIATADPSNPRRDIVVLYVDYGNAVSTGVSNNTNGVVKVKVVVGTPAGSPVDPTDTAIQASVGAGNPFIKLCRVRVGAGVSSVGNSVIDDLRRMATAHVQGAWLYEYQYPWVYVSASSFKIAGVDVRAVFPVGTKIQLYQGSVVKYFVVTATAFSTDSTITVNGMGTYTLTNDIIDRPAYSYELRPQGFLLPGVGTSDIDSGSWPSFRGYAPTGSNVSNGGAVFAKINTLTSIEYDLHADFSVVNQKFTAPYPGVYRFMGTVGAANNTTRMFCSVFKNGVEYQRGTNGAWTGTGNRAQVVAELKLAAGDYVELFGWRAEAGTLNAENFDGLTFGGTLSVRTLT